MAELTPEDQVAVTLQLRQRRAMLVGFAAVAVASFVPLAALGLPVLALVAIAVAWLLLGLVMLRRQRQVEAAARAAGWDPPPTQPRR